MLRELPPKVAHAFVMAVACEMTDQEVADTLNVSARMVRKYVARAMLCCMKLEARLAAGLSDDTTDGLRDRLADDTTTPSPATP
ncbi:RNA polymerase sigma factor [compost metagenome]